MAQDLPPTIFWSVSETILGAVAERIAAPTTGRGGTTGGPDGRLLNNSIYLYVYSLDPLKYNTLSHRSSLDELFQPLSFRSF